MALENMVLYNLGALKGIARIAVQRHQLIKRMEPVAKENEKMKEAVKLIEKNV